MNRSLSHSRETTDVASSQSESAWPRPGEVATEIGLVLALHLAFAFAVTVALKALGIA